MERYVGKHLDVRERQSPAFRPDARSGLPPATWSRARHRRIPHGNSKAGTIEPGDWAQPVVQRQRRSVSTSGSRFEVGGLAKQQSAPIQPKDSSRMRNSRITGCRTALLSMQSGCRLGYCA